MRALGSISTILNGYIILIGGTSRTCTAFIMIYDITQASYWEKPWVIGSPPQWVVNIWEARRGAVRYGSYEHFD